MLLLEANTTLDLLDRPLERNLHQRHATLQIEPMSQHHLVQATVGMVIHRTVLSLLQDLVAIATMDTTARLLVVRLGADIKATSSLHQVAQLCLCQHTIAHLHHLQCYLRRPVHAVVLLLGLTLLLVHNETSPHPLHHVVVCRYEILFPAQPSGRIRAWRMHHLVPVVAASIVVVQVVGTTVSASVAAPCLQESLQTAHSPSDNTTIAHPRHTRAPNASITPSQ